MRIVSWNCGGKFREKYRSITELGADIFVIQECEDPAAYPQSDYAAFAANYLWTGEKKNKGLGVFAKPGIRLAELNWDKYCLRNFLTIRVNDSFDLVAVWACKPYIEEYYIFQSINISRYGDQTVIIGDFNSNAIWDKKHDTRTHTAVVEQLRNAGLVSAYHFTTDEAQGAESKNTFYLYRHPDKGYHIDHCFTAAKNISNYSVYDAPHWLEKSDHVPVEIELPSQRHQ